MDNPGNKSAVAGESANALPINLTVAFAVTEAFAASRTVMSTAVSAVTALGTTEKVEPVIVAVIGKTTLSLDEAV